MAAGDGVDLCQGGPSMLGDNSFVPAEALDPRSRRGIFLKWLRKTHAWIGLWGAALGLLFGITGILQNHRSILKIPADFRIGIMPGTTICGLADGTAWATRTFINKFYDEFAAACPEPKQYVGVSIKRGNTNVIAPMGSNTR